VPVILMTGQPSVRSAATAVEHGALQYLMKPIALLELGNAVTRAVRLHQMARATLEAAEVTGSPGLRITDRIGLSVRLDSALESLWMALQPVVRAKDGSVYGYEALLRSQEPTLPHPQAVLEAAERLGRLNEVGRVTRSRAASAIAGNEEAILFVNLHPRDLSDENLVDPSAPLTRIAGRVVLEITERAAMEPSEALKARILELRRLGYRVAIDDLGQRVKRRNLRIAAVVSIETLHRLAVDQRPLLMGRGVVVAEEPLQGVNETPLARRHSGPVGIDKHRLTQRQRIVTRWRPQRMPLGHGDAPARHGARRIGRQHRPEATFRFGILERMEQFDRLVERRLYRRVAARREVNGRPAWPA
jgi:EAL domain-containing protein (putative c-di-GMP-specific phosphodiesterase class I)